MGEVLKRDGRREIFREEKIRKAVDSAAREANVKDARRNEIVEQVSKTVLNSVSGMDEIETNEIRETVLRELRSLEPSVHEAWEMYDRKRGRI